MALRHASVQCPYCWEEFEIAVDPSQEGQPFVEDCSVCCRPIVLNVHFGEEGGDPEISATKENE